GLGARVGRLFQLARALRGGERDGVAVLARVVRRLLEEVVDRARLLVPDARDELLHRARPYVRQARRVLRVLVDGDERAEVLEHLERGRVIGLGFERETELVERLALVARRGLELAEVRVVVRVALERGPDPNEDLQRPGVVAGGRERAREVHLRGVIVGIQV